jgi:hypothetical protein
MLSTAEFRFKGHKIRATLFVEKISEKELHLFAHWKIGMVGAEAV